MEYNTQKTKLILPEYGRLIHQMVEATKQIQDKEERNLAAQTIIRTMMNLHPYLKNKPDAQNYLWEHLFIMADFELDVDAPIPVPDKEKIAEKPRKLPYPQQNYPHRYYGQNIQKMIVYASELPDSEEKLVLIRLIANHMKKLYVIWNKDEVTDEVIKQHLFEISQGKLNLESDESLMDTQRFTVSSKPKKKFKKKNNRNRNFR